MASEQGSLAAARTADPVPQRIPRPFPRRAKDGSVARKWRNFENLRPSRRGNAPCEARRSGAQAAHRRRPESLARPARSRGRLRYAAGSATRPEGATGTKARTKVQDEHAARHWQEDTTGAGRQSCVSDRQQFVIPAQAGSHCSHEHRSWRSNRQKPASCKPESFSGTPRRAWATAPPLVLLPRPAARQQPGPAGDAAASGGYRRSPPVCSPTSPAQPTRCQASVCTAAGHRQPRAGTGRREPSQTTSASDDAGPPMTSRQAACAACAGADRHRLHCAVSGHCALPALLAASGIAPACCGRHSAPPRRIGEKGCPGTALPTVFPAVRNGPGRSGERFPSAAKCCLLAPARTVPTQHQRRGSPRPGPEPGTLDDATPKPALPPPRRCPVPRRRWSGGMRRSAIRPSLCHGSQRSCNAGLRAGNWATKVAVG